MPVFIFVDLSHPETFSRPFRHRSEGAVIGELK
jgi:hypothetical protein